MKILRGITLFLYLFLLIAPEIGSTYGDGGLFQNDILYYVIFGLIITYLLASRNWIASLDKQLWVFKLIYALFIVLCGVIVIVALSSLVPTFGGPIAAGIVMAAIGVLIGTPLMLLGIHDSRAYYRSRKS
jgi:hypothetical protein